MRNLWLKKWKEFRLYYGRYKCRSWNAGKRSTDSDSLQSFTMYFMKEVTMPPGEASTLDKVPVWNHDCYSPSKSK